MKGQLQYSVYLGLTSSLCSSFFLSVFATDRIVQMFAFQIKVDLFSASDQTFISKKEETFDKNQKVFGLIETCLLSEDKTLPSN